MPRSLRRCERLKRAGSGRPAAAAALALLVTAACDTQRDRPLGPAAVTPPTTVIVAAPPTDAVVGADSLVDIVVVARGAIDAVEFFAVRIGLPDTVGQEREDLNPRRDSVLATFTLQVPNLPTGVNLEIRGVAEDAAQDRHLSEPVFVTVIDCERYVFICGDGQ